MADTSEGSKSAGGKKGEIHLGSPEEVANRLTVSGALLTRTDLRALGLQRGGVDAVFGACPIVRLPGYARPLIRVEDYLALIEDSTSRGDRVIHFGQLGRRR